MQPPPILHLTKTLPLDPPATSEQKRQAKAAEKAAKKAEKEAARGNEGPATPKSAAPSEEDLDPNQYFELRSKAVAGMKAGGPINPYVPPVMAAMHVYQPFCRS